MIKQYKLITLFICFLLPGLVYAADTDTFITQDLTASWQGIVSLFIFVITYSLIVCEETIHLRKSKPAMVAAGVLWGFFGMAYSGSGGRATVASLFPN